MVRYTSQPSLSDSAALCKQATALHGDRQHPSSPGKIYLMTAMMGSQSNLLLFNAFGVEDVGEVLQTPAWKPTWGALRKILPKDRTKFWSPQSYTHSGGHCLVLILDLPVSNTVGLAVNAHKVNADSGDHLWGFFGNV